MISADGEIIEFLNPIILEGPVEIWLCKIEAMMQKTLQVKLTIVRAHLRKQRHERDKWIKVLYNSYYLSKEKGIK